MKGIRIAAVFAAMLLSHNSLLAAGDAEAGKAKSAACAACHGTDGISPQDIWPNLKGQKAAYLVLSLKAYRDGTRDNAIMKGMSAGLTDADIENLAEYYSGL